jgi:hypothetical protein
VLCSKEIDVCPVIERTGVCICKMLHVGVF